MNVSVIILHWNGKKLLNNCLQSLKKALKKYKLGKAEVIIVDNHSKAGSCEFVKNTYPEFRVLRTDKNLGFTRGIYFGVEKSRYPIIITLNNDTVVRENFLTPLITPFKENDNLFSVGSKILLNDKKTLDFGKAVPKNILGFLKIKFYNNEKKEFTFYTCAAAAAYDKKKFLSLGGFDNDLLYWEDCDICFRAWRKGWPSVIEPESLVYHERQSSMKKIYSRYEILKISRKSHFLFMWKNMKSPFFWIQHILFILPIAVIATLMLKLYFIPGLIEALPEFKKMVTKNKRLKKGIGGLKLFKNKSLNL